MEDATLGEKIKEFRLASGKSQFEIETQIGAAPGSVSRMESGKTNPTKETLLSIAKVLKLTDRQTSYLFGLDFTMTEKVLDIIHKLTAIQDQETLLQTFTNEVSEKLNYVTTAVLLLDNDNNLVAQCYAQNKPSVKAMSYVTKNFKSLYVNSKTAPQNYLLISALEKKIMVSEDFYNFSRGAISKPLIRIVQQIVSIKQGIAIPILAEGKSLGTAFFSKPETKNYTFEIELLEAVTKQLAILINRIKQSTH